MLRFITFVAKKWTSANVAESYEVARPGVRGSIQGNVKLSTANERLHDSCKKGVGL
jgi:hypothetical protein